MTTIFKSDEIDESTKELIDVLAQNYFTTITTDDPKITDYNSQNIYPEIVFQEPLPSALYDYPKNAKGWSRNILIIGAGAHKGTNSFMPTGDKVAKELEDELKLSSKDIAAEELKKRKYIKQSELFLKTKLDIDNFDEAAIDDLKKKLMFEGRLHLLCTFYEKEDILKEIQKLFIQVKHFPCEFSEIIAHLLKHRFIDIIINFNFDEILDSAIEDEVGSDNYTLIVGDIDNQTADNIFENSRLRCPIYIKPHGTISKPNTIKFTHESYIDISTDTALLLSNLFSGKLNNKSNKLVRNINFIVSGFALKSTEFEALFRTQIKLLKSKDNDLKLDTVRFFIFDPRAEANVKEFVKLNNLTGVNNLFFHLFDDQNGKIPNFSTVSYIKKIYTELRTNKNIFKKPFLPHNLNRHELLTKFFNSKVIENQFLNNTINYEEFYKQRAIFNLFYKLFKNPRNISLTQITSDRVSKYYNLYLKESLKNGTPTEGILNLCVNDFEFDKVSDSDIYFNLKFKGTVSKNIDIDEQIFNILVDKLTFHSLSKSELTDIYNNNIKPIVGSGIYDISPKYIDSKLGRLNYTLPEQTLLNNCALTYKLYDFAVRRRISNEWKSMVVIANSAKSLYNLHSKADNASTGDSHLIRMFKEGINIQLLIENETLINPDTGKQYIEDIKSLNNFNSKSFNAYKFNDQAKQIHKHYMFLFFSDDDFKIPIFAIYHFKPIGKNRINPIYFDASDTSPNKENDKISLIRINELWDYQQTNNSPI